MKRSWEPSILPYLRATAKFAILALLTLGVPNTKAGPALDFEIAGAQLENQVVTGTLGWSFTVHAELQITHIGLFDVGGNGLSESHAAGIWTASGTLVASATIPTGLGANLVGQFRYTPIPPTTLAPGQYVIGAEYIGISNDSRVSEASQVTTDSRITYIGGRYAVGAGLRLPPNAGVTGSYFGPNFIITANQTDLIATGLNWDEAGDQLAIFFEVAGAALTTGTVARLAWSNGPTLSDILSEPSLAHLDIPVPWEIDSYGPFFISTPDLGAIPDGATHLLLIVDPLGTVDESNEDNNLRAIQIPLIAPKVVLKIAAASGLTFEMGEVLGLFASIYNENPVPISIQLNWSYSTAMLMPNLSDSFEPIWPTETIVEIPAYGSLVDQRLANYLFEWDWLPKSNPFASEPRTAERINQALLGVSDLLAELLKDGKLGEAYGAVGPLLSLIDVLSVSWDAQSRLIALFESDVRFGFRPSHLPQRTGSSTQTAIDAPAWKLNHYHLFLLFSYLAQEFTTAVPALDFLIEGVCLNIAATEYRQAADPPDSLYRTIPEPEVVDSPVLLTLPDSPTKRYAESLLAIDAFKTAAATARDRAVAAATARDYLWESTQLNAAARLGFTATQFEIHAISNRNALGANVGFPKHYDLSTSAEELLSSLGWSDTDIEGARANIDRLNSASAARPLDGLMTLSAASVISMYISSQDATRATRVRVEKMEQSIRELSDSEVQQLTDLRRLVETGLEVKLPTLELQQAITTYLDLVLSLELASNNSAALAAHMRAGLSALAGFQRLTASGLNRPHPAPIGPGRPGFDGRRSRK